MSHCQAGHPNRFLRIFLLILFLAGPLCGAEKVRVPIGAKPVECEVLKISKEGVLLKTGGMELTVPLDKLNDKDVARCYKASPPADDPSVRLDLGAYLLSRLLLTEAEEELTAASKGDAACKEKAAKLLGVVKTLREVAAAKKDGTAASKKDESGGDEADSNVSTGDPFDDPGEGDDLAKAFRKKNVPPLSPADMKAFLDKRQGELKSVLSGDWRMKETKHFYCFTDMPDVKLAMVIQWNEALYDRLCEVLRHREGDKLWNNKMPIYYFSTFAKFQRFAVEIDHEPGGARSGGYFAAEGRQVHICIPFMSERFHKDVDVERAARNTLNHEGTHAFLQLTGEDVPISHSLHEGMAQFIEFWYDPDKNPARRQRVFYLQQYLIRKSLPSWEDMRNRPMGGMDMEGYALAWSKLEFLYWNSLNPDHQKLPQMIRLIKAGKTEEEAMVTTYGMPVDKLEAAYRIWLKPAVKKSFTFGP